MPYNVTQSISQTIQELFVPMVEQYQRDNSPTFEDIYRSAKNVAMNRIGRDLKVIWPFRVGVAGSFEYGSIAGPQIATTPGGPASGGVGTPPGVTVYQDVESWAGIAENVAQGLFKREITLKKAKVNMMFPIELIALAQLENAAIDDEVEAITQGCAELTALSVANAWWSDSATISSVEYPGLLGTFATGATPTLAPGSPLTITLATGSIQKWAEGMRVDLFLSTSTTRVNTAGAVFVDVPDGYSSSGEGNLTLYVLQGSYTLANATYHITFRNSGRESGITDRIPTPFLSTIKSSGTVFGIPIASFPRYTKSYVVASTGNSYLDERLLLGDLATIHRKKGRINQIDTIIGGSGVMAGLFQGAMVLPGGPAYGTFGGAGGATNQGATRFERNNATVQMKMGAAEGVSFTLGGRMYTLKVDDWCPSGTIVGSKLKNGNWGVIRPKKLAGSKGHPSFDQAVEFLASLFGSTNGIMLPYNQVGGANAGAVTNMLQAPGWMRYEILPEILCGYKRTNLKEWYGASEA